VTFNDLNKFEIEFYVNKYKPFDKAGSYGIQEWIGLIGVKKIEGSYTNVVGLPASMVYTELKKFI
jgi:septum formation protein